MTYGVALPPRRAHLHDEARVRGSMHARRASRRPRSQSERSAAASGGRRRAGSRYTANLELRGVSRRARHRSRRVDALVNVSLVVEPGSLVAVRAPAGRQDDSSLARGGPRSSDVGRGARRRRLAGAPAVARLAALRRRRIGYVSTVQLDRGLTAVENVAIPLELDGARAAMLRHGDEGVEMLGLGALASRFPDELSGGEQQRVAIARRGSRDRVLLSRTSRPAHWTRSPERGPSADARSLRTRRCGCSSPTTRDSRRGPTKSCFSATKSRRSHELGSGRSAFATAVTRKRPLRAAARIASRNARRHSVAASS